MKDFENKTYDEVIKALKEYSLKYDDEQKYPIQRKALLK